MSPLDLFIATMAGIIAFVVGLIIASLFEIVGLEWWWLVPTYAVFFVMYLGYRALRDRYHVHWADRLFPDTADPEGDRRLSLAGRYAVAAGFIIALAASRATSASDLMAHF